MSSSSYKNLDEENLPIAYPSNESNYNRHINDQEIDNYGNYVTNLIEEKKLDNSSNDNMVAFTAGTAIGSLASCFLCNIL